LIYLLDTSALLAHHRQGSGWEQVQAIFAEDGAEILIASVTIAEFARRMQELGAGEPGIRETLVDYQMLFSEVIAVDGAVAWAAFQLGCRTSKRLPLVDALIAAAAQARGACLVHRDEHLAAIPAELVQQMRLPDPVSG
jgi:predicted nucleic acid-binding protein